MKKRVLFLVLLITLGVRSYSQITFEKGYFVDGSGQRIECLIRNMDWKNNPSEFEYMLSEGATVQQGSIGTVKEFGVDNVSRYISATVMIDRSRSELNNLSSDKNPKFQEEQLFLKVLIDGKASLYYYEGSNLTRFFYTMDNSEIRQLVYKIYKTDRSSMAQNDFFKQQLYIDLKCETITQRELENISYTKRDLQQLFMKYNSCAGASSVNYDSKRKRDLFNLTLRPGLNISSLDLRNLTDGRAVDFGNKSTFRLGIETEFVLPTNKNKWSIIVEPTFQYYKSERETRSANVTGGTLISRANYQSIEIPFGVRYYCFLNDVKKISAGLSYVLDYDISSSIELSRNDGSILESLKGKSTANFALELGYKYKDKYSIGARYQTKRQILADFLFWRTRYNTISFVFGYSLF